MSCCVPGKKRSRRLGQVDKRDVGRKTTGLQWKDTEKSTERITEIKTEKNRKGGRNVRRRRTEKKVGVLLEGGQKRRQEF